jgi:hypothetical protein
MNVPKLDFAFEIRAQVAAPIEVGQTIAGSRRRMVPITGGTFVGPSLDGRILPGGADWQIIHADGLSELDSRYLLETTDGAVIAVRNRGIRDAPPEIMMRLLAGQAVDPSLVYFRTTPTFETSAPALQWLTRSVFVGIGERFPAEVVVRFWRLA